MPRMRNISASSEEEDETYTCTQEASQSLSDEEMGELAAKVCHYVLLNESKKIPAKAADIRKLVLRDKSRHFKDAMKEASGILEEVYGYKINEIKKNEFILVNSRKLEDVPPINSVSSSDEVRGLLTVVLTGIFMSGGVMQEGPMKEFLKNFEIDIDQKANHPVFGNVDKLMHQDLRKQCYLEITLDKSMDPPINEYRWGERAHLEVSKKDILEFVCKVYGNNMRPEMWTAQWHAIENEKKKKTDTAR